MRPGGRPAGSSGVHPSSSPSPAQSPAGPLFAGRSLGRVVANRSLGSLAWLTLEVPGWPGTCPGQFALLQAEDSCCFLGRALSIAQDGPDSVSFLVAPVGKGTREICALGEGERAWVIGPLGNGFDLPALTAGPGRVVIVGGGVGVAPFPLLLTRLADGLSAVGDGASGLATVATGRPVATEGPAPTVADAPPSAPALPEILVLLGFRDAAQAGGAQPIMDAVARLKERGATCRTEVVTEDGSVGRAERVSDALGRELRSGDRLAVCGPWAMTVAVAGLCASVSNVQVWFNLEAGMACGVGSCHGCVVSLADGTTARVCREGPVFPAAALFERWGGERQ